MSTIRVASRKFVQMVPVRTTVEVYRTQPPRPQVGPEPVLVEVRGIVDLSPDPTERALPFWFDAEVEIYEGRTAEIVSFRPAYGSIHGGGDVEARLVYIYEHAFSRSLVDTRLKIIGVK